MAREINSGQFISRWDQGSPPGPMYISLHTGPLKQGLASWATVRYDGTTTPTKENIMAIGPGPCETNSISYPKALGLAPLASDEIRLQAGGDGWMGTFGNALRFVVADILSTGGVVAQVQVNHNDDHIHMTRGKIVHQDPEGILFEDDVLIGWEDVLSITF